MARSETRPITIAILALGGQGGGVLAEWTVKAAELSGYRAQYTSVQGVAQRTGSTVYYIELFPEAEIAAKGKEPVLALMPVPGDVDVVVASELMEAGRAIMRGFVTPERTTLIGSTHRVYAISEKIAMADGRSDGDQVLEAAQARAKRWIGFDMDKTAKAGGSVISAAMFGALAGSEALPIPRSVFEDVIRASKVAVEANLRTFALGYERARSGYVEAEAEVQSAPDKAPPAAVQPLLHRIEALPFIVQDSVRHGLRRTIDYQDLAYGARYLERVEQLAVLDRAHGGERLRHELLREAARHLALWMSFEDTYRVADLKTRGSRFARFREEVSAAPDQIVAVTEFMHPRLIEVADSLPPALGQWVARQKWLGRFFQEGRQIRTSSLRGFLLLKFLSAGRHIRLKSQRFLRENAAIETWLARLSEATSIDYALAVELARCQKLVRGYGDTNERGTRNFETLMQAFDQHKHQPRFSQRLKLLKDAALADEKGEALAKALAG